MGNTQKNLRMTPLKGLPHPTSSFIMRLNYGALASNLNISKVVEFHKETSLKLQKKWYTSRSIIANDVSAE